MIIKDIFEKSIDRDLKGVIKVGQAQEENIRQELEEYVVTRELQKHFKRFFENYKRGILGHTDKMGVWISGFFGSGKSHFLKIISYILENKIVDGVSAIEYFERDKKIKDTMTLADMKLAASTPSTVILFNIDSKSESTGKKDKEAILSVFLKVFNEKLGYCGAFPHVADLERRLDADGKYDEFKAKFNEITGDSWEEERYAVAFVQDEVVEALSSIGFMSEEAANRWCEMSTEPYSLSIDRFGKLIKDYLDSKEKNHHIIFLVDEIGQYVGTSSELMLNLQTVTEDLGTVCGGKAWVIVTSQQDIDSITKVKGNDFSKIQGRFDTRLSLASSDVAEVIKKRILAKNETAKASLKLLFDDKGTDIKNRITFDDDVEKKLYKDRDDFADTYPFIPYQFNLLGSVLTAIRTYGASGKHLADGERSMLAMFKESAANLKDKEIGALVPFHMFYGALEEFIDHSHKGVIVKANDNEKINPEHKDDCFDVNVLKVLFMIKYVKEINSTVNNITSLMFSSIEDDRITLTQKVEAALKRLVKQMYVQKNGSQYVFLTNEEQEINRAIESQTVEQGQITAKVSELIFDGLYDERKYRAPELKGRYSFGFNQIVDSRPYKANQNYPLTLKILTPNCDEITEDSTLRLLSGQSQSVIVVLPDDSSFLEEIATTIRVEQFLQSDASRTATKYDEIILSKKKELLEHRTQSRIFLQEALQEADIYVNGEKIQTQSKDVASRINEAMGKLVAVVYNKLSYIDTATGENEIRALLREDSRQITLDTGVTDINRLALNDVAAYVARNSQRHTKTSMKAITERFMAPPYGFVEADVQWLIAKLFKDGEIAFYVNNEAVSLLTKKPEEILRYITRKEYLEKLMIEKRIKANDKQKRAAREIMKELFHYPIQDDDDDAIMSSFLGSAENLKHRLQDYENRYYDIQPLYPGRNVVLRGKRLLIDVTDTKYTAEFFNLIDSSYDDFMDFSEDFEPVAKFFSGEQKNLWDKALDYLKIYNRSKTYVVDDEVESAVAGMNRIIRMETPYSEIYKLPELCNKFRDAYSTILRKELAPSLDAISEARQRVVDELSGKMCHDSLSASFVRRFDELNEKATKCNNVADLKNIRHEADSLKERCLNEIYAAESELQRKQAAEQAAKGSIDLQSSTTATVKLKKRKSISIKSINPRTTWQIESEADIEKYLAELKSKLNSALEDDTIINIEF